MLSFNWFKEFGRLVGGLPRSYIVFDTETSGISVSKDLVLQMGFVVVDDGQIAASESVFLDWRDHPHVDQSWLRDQLNRLNEHMLSKGRKPFLYEDMAKGIHADEALDYAFNLFSKSREEGSKFVAHNGWRFDVPLFERLLSNRGKKFMFMEHELFDTGCMEKASVLRLLPNGRETLRQFSIRIAGIMKPGLLWSLDKHCMTKYGLHDKVAALDTNNIGYHDAVVDCHATHLLYEAMYQISEKD